MKKVIFSIVVALVVAIIALLTVGYLMMGKSVRRGIEVIGPDATGVAVTVDDIDIGLLQGKVGLDRFVMGNPPGFTDNNSFSLDTLKVAVDVNSVLGNVVIVKNILIDGTHITWEGFGGDNHKKIMQNIDAYAARFKKEGTPKETKEAKEEKAPEKKVIINNFILKNSSLDFIVGGKKIATLPAPDLHLTDIGKKERGLTVREAIEQTYQQVIAAFGKSVSSNNAMLRKKMTELEAKGQELLKQGADLLKTDGASSGLDDIKKGVGDLFKKK